MSAASSGIQSITLLLLVSQFLSDEVKKDLFERLQNTNENIKNKIRSELEKQQNLSLLEKFTLYCMGGKKIFQNNDDVVILENAIKKFVPSCFINIVEEPEQNLFPDAQVSVLYTLLEYKNSSKHNKLIFSTHSPYLLTALNNCVYASKLKEQGKKVGFISEKYLVPHGSVAAYKLGNGCILDIMDSELHMIDTTAIDDCSSILNEEYDKLFSLDCSDEIDSSLEKHIATGPNQQDVFVVKENGKTYRANNPNKHEACIIRIDNGLISDKDTVKCDYGLCVDDNRFFLIELKGCDLSHACKQILTTLNYMKIHYSKYAYYCRAVVTKVVSPALYSYHFKKLQKTCNNLKYQSKELRDKI